MELNWPESLVIVTGMLVWTFVWFVGQLRGGMLKAIETGFEKTLKEAEQKAVDARKAAAAQKASQN